MLPTGEQNVYGIGVGNKKFMQSREFSDINLLRTSLRVTSGTISSYLLIYNANSFFNDRSYVA